MQFLTRGTHQHRHESSWENICDLRNWSIDYSTWYIQLSTVGKRPKRSTHMSIKLENIIDWWFLLDLVSWDVWDVSENRNISGLFTIPSVEWIDLCLQGWKFYPIFMQQHIYFVHDLIPYTKHGEEKGRLTLCANKKNRFRISQFVGKIKIDNSNK